MRKLLISFVLLTLCVFVNAQSDGQVKIVRTDGTTMIGTLQSADGTAVTIKIAGIEMAVPMSEVQSIEEYSPASAQQNAEATSATAAEKLSDHYADYIITDDNPEYPDSFTVEVDGKEVTMVLVRGGVFNMGYDDWNSRSMYSEPIHQVEVSSFYVSDDYVVSQRIKWEEAKNVIDGIAEAQGTPYRMLTEAEWEFAAIGPVQDIIFDKTYQPVSKITANPINNCKNGDWVQDFFHKFTPQKQINPTGPKEGKDHILRSYAREPAIWLKWCRTKSQTLKTYVRLAISADKIPNTIKESQ